MDGRIRKWDWTGLVSGEELLQRRAGEMCNGRVVVVVVVAWYLFYCYFAMFFLVFVSCGGGLRI